jgi:hypothetical protein
LPTENLVGIHPHKAAVLATQLRRTAQLLVGHSTVTFDALVDGLEDTACAIALYDATEWFAAQARSLQRTLDELVPAYVAAPGPSWDGVAVWRHPYAVAFDNPEAATGAASDAASLLADVLATDDPDPGAVANLVGILGAWQGNEVFATELARLVVHGPQLGVGALAALLQLECEWRRRGSPAEQDAAARARQLTIVTLSAASADGLFDLTFDEALAEVRGSGAEPTTAVDAAALQPLGFLFAPGTRWGTDFLVDAVTRFVVPVNAAFGDQTVQFDVGGIDPRVRVLDAVGGDAAASTVVLGRAGMFDALFAERYGYLDGGRALAEVLRSGTEPMTDPPSASTAEPDARARTMMRFVDWVVHHPDLPPVTRQALGAITVPWIASFRKDTYDDDPTVANPLRALLDETRVAYLGYVADDLHALAALRIGELAWLRPSVWGVAGPGFDGRGLELIANVDRRTSAAVRDGMVRNLDREDAQINFDKEVWNLLMSAFTLPLADGWDFLVDTAVHLVGDLARPPSTMALDYATSFPTLITSDDRKIEHAVLSVLWERRAENHVFDGVAAPPASIVAGEPPELLPIAAMTPASYEALLTWIQENDLRRRAHWEALTVSASG